MRLCKEYAARSVETCTRACVATAEFPGLASRLVARPSRKHPVLFVWNEGGSEKSITVQVNACEYQSFMATTRSLLAARWNEIAREFP